MINGLTEQNPDTRKRKRKIRLPLPTLILDNAIMFLLTLLPVGVIWIFGGNRFWIMGPAILLLLLLVILFAARQFLAPYRYELVVPPGGFLIFAFLAYLAASIGFASITYEAKVELFRYISYAAAFWIWVNILSINKRWKPVLILLMFSVSIMALYALIQEVQGTNLVLNQARPEQYGMRASGAYICPNHFAHLLEMLVPVCLAIAFCGEAGVAMRLIAGYTVLVSLPCLYLTESRSGWLGLITGVVVFAAASSLRKGWRKFAFVMLVAPLIAVSLGVVVWKASPRVQARVEAALAGDIRLPLWQDSLVLAKENPVFGHGLGSFRWMYPHYRKAFVFNADAEYAHNEYLHFLIEIGAVGLLLAGLVVASMMVRAVRIIRAGENRDHAYLMAGLVGMVAASLVHAFFDFNFHIFGNVHVFVFLSAALISATHSASRDRVVVPETSTARWIGWGVAAAAAVLLLSYTRVVVSYFYSEAARARVEKMQWDVSQREYYKALSWSPGNWNAHVGLANLLRTRSYWMRNPETRAAWIAEARQHYEMAEAMNPWEADVLYGLGSLYKQEGNQEKALELRRLTVDKVPRQTFYLNELGLQLREMNRYDEAMEVFRSSMAVAATPVAERNIAWLSGKVTPPR